ncbi:phage-related integrase [Fructilactobacillus fructivorans]|uniref:tyrosine-type recombinase/integrase n=1 Tax=Fructilactobacillus fructivorans TaxID=1614 RepID=UPI000704C44E|nr:site-specific integrase [Fructilactobacillus fructivorans]KRN13315.1 phage-related integrase [Fructilactobacillus fructivorans]
MANVIKKRGNNWRARVFYYDDVKKRHAKSATFGTKSKAQKWTIDQENNLNKNRFIKSSTQSLPEYFLEWYKAFKEPHLANSTKRRYMATSNVLKKYWKNIPLQNINYIKYQKFLNYLGDNFALETVRKIHGQTRYAINKAVQMHKISDNFTNGATVYGKAGKKANLKYLEIYDMKKLLNYCMDINYITDISKAMVATSLLTGLRYEEVIGLTWDNINLKKHTLTVNKSYSQVDKQFQKTKNHASNRTISINRTLVELFKKVQIIQGKFLLKHGYQNNNNFVFLNRFCNIISSGSINKSLKYYCNHLGIKQITFHGLRHTHASYLISQNVNIQYVSKRLGHSSVSITQDVYTHLLKDKETEDSNKTMQILDNIN